MTLSDRDILVALGQGLKIEPHPDVLQPASVDLHLHADMLRLVPGAFDPTNERSPRTETIYLTKWDGFVLNPGQFILGATLEHVEIPPGLVGIVTGKSSLARIGLQVEAAGYVDPGWKGRLTLELFNMGPLMLMLRCRMPICQLRLERLSSTPLHQYGDRLLRNHYQDSGGPVAARFDPLNNRSAQVVEGIVVEATAVTVHDVPLVGQGDRASIEAPSKQSESPESV